MLDALFIHAEIPGEALVDAHVRVQVTEYRELAGGRCLRVLFMLR